VPTRVTFEFPPKMEEEIKRLREELANERMKRIFAEKKAETAKKEAEAAATNAQYLRVLLAEKDAKMEATIAEVTAVIAMRFFNTVYENGKLCAWLIQLENGASCVQDSLSPLRLPEDIMTKLCDTIDCLWLPYERTPQSFIDLLHRFIDTRAPSDVAPTMKRIITYLY
jgi:hypothetical protein